MRRTPERWAFRVHSSKTERLLLDWSEGVEQTKTGSRITMSLTHEDIIGSSPETVTRTFSDFKNRHLVVLRGSSVTIPNRAALEHVASA